MGSRCLWDSDTDNYASDVYMNDSLFCCAAVFGLYYY
jgi:tctex1 domain-containing protein 2